MLPREQWEAIEADLLNVGVTINELGERVSWRAVIGFVRHSGPSSALYRVSNGADSAWTLEAQLLALVADILNVANYQRGGGKGAKPKPIERPGVKNEQVQRFGGTAVSAKSFDAWWDEP